jgi:hypothetical protein
MGVLSQCVTGGFRLYALVGEVLLLRPLHAVCITSKILWALSGRLSHDVWLLNHEVYTRTFSSSVRTCSAKDAVAASRILCRHPLQLSLVTCKPTLRNVDSVDTVSNRPIQQAERSGCRSDR